MSWLFTSGGQSTEPSASVLPMNIQCWFPLGFTGVISLLSRGLLRVFSRPQFESISSSALSRLHGPTLTSVHDYRKNHSFDCTHLCSGSVLIWNGVCTILWRYWMPLNSSLWNMLCEFHLNKLKRKEKSSTGYFKERQEKECFLSFFLFSYFWLLVGFWARGGRGKSPSFIRLSLPPSISSFLPFVNFLLCVCMCCAQSWAHLTQAARQAPCPWDSPARILEWVAMSSSRGSSWSRHRTHIFCVSGVGRRILYPWAAKLPLLPVCYLSTEVVRQTLGSRLFRLWFDP